MPPTTEFVMRLLPFVVSPYAHAVLLVVMSIERFILVALPHKAKILLSAKNRVITYCASIGLIVTLSIGNIAVFEECVRFQIFD